MTGCEKVPKGFPEHLKGYKLTPVPIMGKPCTLTKEEHAADSLVRASNLYNETLKIAKEDPKAVGKILGGIVQTLGELIDAVGHLTPTEVKK